MQALCVRSMVGHTCLRQRHDNTDGFSSGSPHSHSQVQLLWPGPLRNSRHAASDRSFPSFLEAFRGSKTRLPEAARRRETQNLALAGERAGSLGTLDGTTNTSTIGQTVPLSTLSEAEGGRGRVACEKKGKLEADGRGTENSSPIRFTETKTLLFLLSSFGRILLLVGLGLGFSAPAMAKQTAAHITTGSTQSSKKEESTIKHQEADKAEAVSPSEGKDQQVVSSQLQKSAGSDNDRLSDAFWKGIPTAVDSLMHSLKIQLDSNPRDDIALGVLLRAVLEKRDMLRALTVLEKLLEVQPKSLKWKFLKARTHEFLGEYSVARQEYQELLKLKPLSARFLQGLVMLLNRAGEETEALELIQAAVNKAMSENKDIEARNLRMLLGQFYTQQGNFEEALKEFSSMIAQDPNDFRPYLCQGVVYTLMGEEAEAEKSLQKYQELCPKEFLDQSYLDDLMLKAKTGSRRDRIARSKIRRPAKKQRKQMKQPTFINKNPVPQR